MSEKSRSNSFLGKWKVLIFLTCMILCVSLLAGCGIYAVNDKNEKTVSTASSKHEFYEIDPIVESTVPVNVTQASVLSGILVLQTENSYYDSSYLVNLSLFDPTTGETRDWAQFKEVDGACPTTLIEFRGTAYFTQRQFSPNYDRIAATKTNSDGSIYAGWITREGEFVNVTSAINPDQSDFSDPPRNSYPQFDANGMFYFLDMNEGVIKKVDPGSLSPDSVEIVAELKDSEDCFYLYPDGQVQCYWTLYSTSCFRNTENGVAINGVHDIIDNTTLLYMKDLYGAKDLSQIYTCINEKDGPQTALLPETTTMLVWDPISSADGQKVAFLSISSSSKETPNLFIVSRDGGNPVSVPTDFVFISSFMNSAPKLQLLDWF